MIKGSIGDIAFGGNGILKDDGFVIFVPFTAPQDTVTVTLTQRKKSHGFGSLVSVDQKSPFRTEPKCAHFGTCGGCQLQHLNYAAQLDAKRNFVQDALKRIGKIDFPVPPVVPASLQWNYRRHIRLNLRKKEKGFQAGYIGCDGQQFVPVAACPLFSDSPWEIDLSALSHHGIEQGSLRIFKTASERLILAFSFSPALPKDLEAFAQATLSDAIQGIVFQAPRQKESFGAVHDEISIEGFRFRYSPYGFIQNHPEQSQNIYQALREMITPSHQKVLDLYCGIGISSLLLKRDVIGIESHPESIQLAKDNARLNQVPSVRFVQAKVEGAKITQYQADTVLINPPRTGLLPSIVVDLLRLKAKELLYTSCMPATLARDLKELSSLYEVKEVRAFDMFPQTTHVETIVRLQKKIT